MKRQFALVLLTVLLLGMAAGGSQAKSLPEGDRVSRLLRHGTALGIPTAFVLGRSDQPSMAVGDWNDDGLSDLAVAEPGSDKVWLIPGEGTGRFGLPTSLAVRSRQTVVALADFDGDGLNDQAVADQFAHVTTLVLGKRTGGSSAAPAFAPDAEPLSALLGDFDQDGIADLATVDSAASHVTVLLGDGHGEVRSTRHIAVGLAPTALATGDFNEDGIADLVVANSRSDDVSILLGDGQGGFGAASRFAVGAGPMDVVAADFNGDGVADLAAVNRLREVSILLGDGRGALSLSDTMAIGASLESRRDTVSGSGKEDPRHARSDTTSADALSGSDPEDYEGVVALTLNPTTIAGGSGARSTGTITLNAPAPAGGVVVTLASSNVELAASVPSIIVPAGATTATFTVATNARYRRYSGLAFSVTISATHAATQSATLNVTAQPRPADFNSGSQAGANTQWQGLMCGGIAPIGGNQEILYDCAPATGTGFGSCTFRQECSLGCRRVPPSGGTFNDSCATSGPNAVAVSRNHFVSGDHVPATVVTGAAVTIPTTGVPSAVSLGANARSFSPDDVGGLHFPAGATSMPFDVATSYVPAIEFVDVSAFWYDADIPPFLITNGRGGHAWVAMVPPDPPPTQPIPTPVQLKIVGLNPVTGGQPSLGQVHLSGIPYGIGPTITLTSSHPAIASPVPASITPAASNLLGFDVDIETHPPVADTDVTITATDGRYSFSGTLRVLVPPPPPVLAGVSVNPTSVVGGNSATGTVTLSAPQTGPTVVQVAIIDTAPATLPSNNPPCPPSSRCHNVTVPAGATSASFTIVTSVVTGQFNLNINAHLDGSPGRTALLLITPGGPLALSTLTLNPTDVTGGASVTGTVALNGSAPAGGSVVTLSRDNTAATVPASVTVPAGQSRASFTVTTSQVTATTNVRISATFNGVTANADMTLFTLLSAVLFPGNVPGGTATTGTVFLSAPAPSGGTVVALSSANTALATVPASVTVPAGQTSATFTVNTAPVTALTPVVITASSGGTTVSETLFLVVSRAVSSVALNPGSVSNGNPSIGTVTLRAAAPSGNAIVDLASSNTLLAVVPSTVTVPAGQTSATFTVNTAPVSATATVVISATYENVTQSATLTLTPSGSPGVTLSTLSLNPTSVAGGSSSTGTVTLSAAAPAGGAVVSLSDNSSAVTVPASVTVSAGATSRTFTVTTSSVTASTSATITALMGGVSRTATLTVNPAPPPAPSAPSLVSPANQATVSQPITFDWTDAANATTYNIQIDNSSNFTTPLTLSQTVGVSQAMITGLPAQQLWWRVRGINSAGVAGPFSSSRRFTAQTAPATASLSALSVSPSSVVGGAAAQGTVTLTSGAPSGGAVVSLSSSSGSASVPASVTVAAGATTASFTVSTSTVAASTSATLTATYNTVSRTATLTVTPPPPAASLSALSVSPTSVTGGNTAQGTVTLTSGAPSGGAVVSLSSSSNSASVPASVLVAAGATTVSFTVSTSTVAASTSATLTATYNTVSRTVVLTVTPVPTGPLPAPTLSSPAADARFLPGQNIVFDWSDMTGATSYTIQIDDQDTFPAPQIVSQTVTPSTYSNSTLPTRQMWWRVRANDSAGNPGNWSSVRRVEVKN